LPDETPLLEMRGIHKSFGGVEVLHGVDLTLKAGEIHALVGENGAGKSTLIKILGGVHRDHRGEMRINGQPVRFDDPRAASGAGVAVIHQELALIPHLTVADNLFLGRERVGRLGFLDRGKMASRARAVLGGQLGVELDMSRPVSDLPLAVQQLVEIAKSLLQRARILVMDEPTSALSDADTQRLFDTVRQLAAQGVGVIYISHRMEEIYALADRITVLRDGRRIGTATPASLSRKQLVQWMVGREVEQFFPRRKTHFGPQRLRVRRISLPTPGRDRWLVRDVSFRVQAGEIVGLAGLVGSGASELLRAIFGGYGSEVSGRIEVGGAALARRDPRVSLRAGLALLTSDRKASGLVLPMSVLGNLSLSSLQRCRRLGFLDAGREREQSAPLLARMDLRATSLAAPVSTLSGGNQQKVVMARCLLTEPKVLLLDEPTRGIDVAAKADIYALLEELTAAQMAIVLITSELPELLALADRVLVLHRGRIHAEFARGAATQERIIEAAMGRS
jgi:ABC-type sugar transport system ATPase subunit